MPNSTDTIAAIATARGQAALAIVRMSGPEAVAVADRAFPSKDLTAAESHTVHVGFLHDAEGQAVDQVVVTLFRAPRSATGEDVVEVTCHGGDRASALVLDALLGHGARLAEPGAFTQRAFLNGKLDLAQAEAIADLIHASSGQAHRVSLAQIRGRYSELLEHLRTELLDTCAYVELELDFGEEDVEFADRAALVRLLERGEALLGDLLGSYHLGQFVRDGVRVVIGGRPNAGKSTLLNALVGHARAIVSATPGTTRDAVEAEAEFGGLRFRFVDTAGLRDTADAIEAEGVRRATAHIESADALVYVYDAALGLDSEEHALLHRLREDRPDLPVFVVANKADLAEGAAAESVALPLSAHAAQHDAALLAPLTDALVEAVAAGLGDAEASAIVTNARHRQHLAHARDALARAHAAFDAGLSGDTFALDLRVALDELGAITGAVTRDDVLGQIFSRFCIGK